MIIAVLLAELAKWGHNLHAKYRSDQKKRNIIKHKSLLSHIKISQEILTFRNNEIETHKSYRHKNPIFLEDVDIEKVLVFNKISSGEKNYKYFIGYLYNGYKVKALYRVLLKPSAYVKSYDGQTKWMTFLIKNDDLT